jgi:hypothetical protein
MNERVKTSPTPARRRCAVAAEHVAAEEVWIETLDRLCCSWIGQRVAGPAGCAEDLARGAMTEDEPGGSIVIPDDVAFVPVSDDLHAELTVLGRYLSTVTDEEIELLQIAARTPAGRSERLDTAYAALADGLNAELAEWITEWAPGVAAEQRTVLAAPGVNSILGARYSTTPFGRPVAHVADDQYLKEWTAALAARVRSLR